MSWRHQQLQAWNTKHILLNNLGTKQSLVMKFGQYVDLD